MPAKELVSRIFDRRNSNPDNMLAVSSRYWMKTGFIPDKRINSSLDEEDGVDITNPYREKQTPSPKEVEGLFWGGAENGHSEVPMPPYMRRALGYRRSSCSARLDCGVTVHEDEVCRGALDLAGCQKGVAGSKKKKVRIFSSS